MRQYVCELSNRTVLFSARRGRFRFHLSTRSRCHDREKDFNYPRYLLMHTHTTWTSEFVRRGVWHGWSMPLLRQLTCVPDGRSFEALVPTSTTGPAPRLGRSRWRSALHKWPKEWKSLGYCTVREDHRTGFHCCQTLRHTVIDDLDSEEARKHEALEEETRLLSLSLLTKDCITTLPSNKVEGYPFMFFLCCATLLVSLLHLSNPVSSNCFFMLCECIPSQWGQLRFFFFLLGP